VLPLQLHCPLHLLLTRESSLGTTTLVSSAYVEWRKVLVHGRLSLNVELKGGDGAYRTVWLLRTVTAGRHRECLSVAVRHARSLIL